MLRKTRDYSIQANAQPFSITYAGHSVTAWEQFVFLNAGTSGGEVFIEYWLFNWYSNYGSCPSNVSGINAWFTAGSGSTISCVANSYSTSTPAVSPTKMVSWYLYAYADYSGYDEVELCGPTNCYTLSVTYTVLNL